MASLEQISSLASALEEYAPKLGPYFGKHSIYNLASAHNIEDKVSRLAEEATKAAGSCKICLNSISENEGRIYTRWSLVLDPPSLQYKSSQMLCSHCYTITDLEQMTKLLASRENMSGFDDVFLRANGHTGQGTSAGVSMLNECCSIANALRLQLRPVPLKLCNADGEETDMKGIMTQIKVHLLKSKPSKPSNDATPAKSKSKRIMSQTPAPAKTKKEETKKRRKTMD